MLKFMQKVVDRDSPRTGLPTAKLVLSLLFLSLSLPLHPLPLTLFLKGDLFLVKRHKEVH